MGAMQILRFEQALLPGGWAQNVSVVIDDGGDIVRVTESPAGTGIGTLPGCALPGVPNLHSHAHQRAMAGLAEYTGAGADSFWSWREVMYGYVSRIAPAQLQSIAAMLYLEMLKSGYTTVAEFQYLHHDRAGRPYQNPAEMSLRTCVAAADVGIGMTCLPVLYQSGDFGGKAYQSGQKRFINDLDSYCNINSQIVDYIANIDDINSGLAVHSLRAVGPELLQQALACRVPADGPIHIHIAEQNKEVDACIAWSGQRPVEWLLSHCDVDRYWCLVHATHMNDEEAEQLAETGAVVGLCPTTEANLGDGMFRARPYLAHKGRFGLGSDSHISVNPVEEMRWFEYGQRLLHKSRNVVASEGMSTGRFLFERAVAGGARACGRKTGRIEPGFRADLIVVDTRHPILFERSGDALLDSWIFSGNANLIEHVFVGGRHVIENGAHADEERIVENFKAAVPGLAI